MSIFHVHCQKKLAILLTSIMYSRKEIFVYQNTIRLINTDSKPKLDKTKVEAGKTYFCLHVIIYQLKILFEFQKKNHDISKDSEKPHHLLVVFLQVLYIQSRIS